MNHPAPACLGAAALLLAAAPAFAQTSAGDPSAAVPETRYQPVHEHRAPARPEATPDRNWQAGNRAVLEKDSAADPHAGHAGHAHHPPAAPAQPAADPHAHHQGDHGHHAGQGKKDQHR